MTKTFLIIFTLLVGLILQTTLAPRLAIDSVAPNLLLVIILFWVVLADFRKIWWLIILAGLVWDLFSGLPFGLINLSLMITSALIDWFKRSIFSFTRWWVLASLMILGTLIYNLLFFVLSRLFESNLALDFKKLLIEAIYNLVLIVILYGVKKILYQKPWSRKY